jgi:hypothetical protein
MLGQALWNTAEIGGSNFGGEHFYFTGLEFSIPSIVSFLIPLPAINFSFSRLTTHALIHLL